MRPLDLDRDDFIACFGGIFEHSPWIAAAAFDAGLPEDANTADGLHRALYACVTAAPREQQLALINAHPDLAGKLAVAKQLTADSTSEQASAGLDSLTPQELARFTALNGAYKARFGFPFIMAVRGASKADILAAFERRLGHSPDEEFNEALAQIGRITLLRLKTLLPD